MRKKLIALLAVVSLVVAAGCVVPGGSNTEQTKLYASSHGETVNDFQYLRLNVKAVGVYETANDTWRTKTTSQYVDLTRVQGDNATFVTTMDLPTGEYSKVYYEVEYSGGALKSGADPSVETKSDQLTVQRDFSLDGVNNTSYVLDFRVIPNVDDAYVVTTSYETSGVEQPINKTAST